MEELNFNFRSNRAVKARLARRLQGIWIGVILSLGAVLFFLGITLLAYSLAVGWLIASFSAVPLMVAWWYYGELKLLPPDENLKGIDGILSGDILSRLPQDPTPRDIAAAVGGTSSGWFFSVRFGVTPSFLENIVSDNKADTAMVWQEARDLCQKMGQKTITGTLLVYALVKSVPEHEMLLARLHLQLSDLEKGALWHVHILDLIAHHSKPKRTGGIGRDLAFGYIPSLTRFGQNISEQISRGGLLEVELESHKDALEQMMKTFSSGGRQNVALVGANGSGKTSVVHAFAARLLDGSMPQPDSLKFRQVFVLDASSLLASAKGRGDLEGLIMQILSEAYVAKNIIICLENAELFFEEGVGSVDITNVLLPILEAGRLRMILTMDEQKFLRISSRNALLVNALNRVSLAPASEEETIAIMQDQLINFEFRYKVTYTYQSLQEAYRLSERYVHDLAQPGRAVKLIEAAASYAEKGLVTVNSVHQAIEKTLGVKVGQVSDEAERGTLLNLENLIHKRMVNQTRAVQVVSDAIRRARAGVRNQNRPIGTFLFLGPTGVGKTELAKALGEIYFGGEDRMIRIDLNNFVRAEDVSRLIADGANDAMSLTARVMKQPFSVVLFDEIEKAHPSVLTTLLQLLDEGILRDEKNREINFRDTIIIATSNAGAERIREYIERGYRLEQFEKTFADELIQSNQFRPEFLNRFDEIVIFRPLEKPELLQVVDLIIGSINKTLAPQKITVEVDNEAKGLLVEKGYDPRLGARPLRRVVQRTVENTVAKQMLSGSVGPGSTVKVSFEEVQRILGNEEAASAMISNTANN